MKFYNLCTLFLLLTSCSLIQGQVSIPEDFKLKPGLNYKQLYSIESNTGTFYKFQSTTLSHAHNIYAFQMEDEFLKLERGSFPHFAEEMLFDINDQSLLQEYFFELEFPRFSRANSYPVLCQPDDTNIINALSNGLVVATHLYEVVIFQLELDNGRIVTKVNQFHCGKKP